MTPLARVLKAKLAVTVIFWAGPLLLTPASFLTKAGLPCQGLPLVRLLGWAYVALCVGYVFGLRAVSAGRCATSAVTVGIVSNAGTGVYLMYFGVIGAWAGWHPMVRFATWAFASVTLALAFGLYWFGLRDDKGKGQTRVVRPTCRADSGVSKLNSDLVDLL